MTKIVDGLDEKTVLIGHSMGGLVVQLMLQQGLASAAVAVDSAPAAGVFNTQFSFLKADWGHITPFASLDSPVVMSFERRSIFRARTPRCYSLRAPVTTSFPHRSIAPTTGAIRRRRIQSSITRSFRVGRISS
jgi:pimeloyl-ACP methyl ester carboxylesterase